MQPYTLDDAERDLRAALTDGDPAWIERASRQVDKLDATADRSPIPLLSAALWYAEHGLHIFPLQPGRKVPMPGSSGCKDATTDPATIRAWWTTTPEANIGIATGYAVDVVDIDGPEAQAVRARHYEKFSTLGTLGTVSTPRAGGMHIYVPASGQGNKANLLPKIDYRGLGGYVVAPPSVITSGPNPGEYEWIRPIDTTALASLPTSWQAGA